MPAPIRQSTTHLAEVGSAGYAEIYVAGGAAGQTPGVSPGVKVTGFTTNGLSSGITADAANDKITTTVAGLYYIKIVSAFSGTANADFTFALYINGSPITGPRLRRVLGGTGDVGSASLSWIASIGAAQSIEVYAFSSAAGKTFTLVESVLIAIRIG